jgi:hypothetical protein
MSETFGDQLTWALAGRRPLNGWEGKDAMTLHPEAERVAREFHEAYEELAGTFHYKTREASAVPWADVPDKNKSLMIAVVDRLIYTHVIEVHSLPGTAAPGIMVDTAGVATQNYPLGQGA